MRIREVFTSMLGMNGHLSHKIMDETHMMSHLIWHFDGHPLAVMKRIVSWPRLCWPRDPCDLHPPN